MRKIGLVSKIIVGILVVSVITYGCSAMFIFGLKDWIAPSMTTWVYISIILMLGILWTVVLGWLGAVWLVKPLRRLTVAANEAAKGNLRVAIPRHASRDEIYELSVSFEKMMTELRHMIASISASAEFAREQANALSGGMDQAAHQVEEIAGATEAISEGAAAQAEAAETTWNAVATIKRAAGDIDRQADTAKRLSEDMLTALASSHTVVRSLTDGMVELASFSRETMSLVQQLKDNAAHVRGISRMVGDIAEQTHLLALNAAIEAARAGDLGQGFAVVAGEIRKLAEESASAVNHIDQLITAMEQGVGDVVQRAQAQEQLAHREAEQGQTAIAAYNRVDQAVRETAHAVEDIAHSIAVQLAQITDVMSKIREVGDVADRIADRIRQVNSSMQQHMAVMQELASSSAELDSQADTLNEKTGVFQI